MAWGLVLTAAATGLSMFASKKKGESNAATMVMNAEAAFADAKASRAAADNSRREADMQDLSTELYGFNVDQARRSAKLLHMQAEVEEGATDIVYAQQRVEESRIVEDGRKTLAANRLYFAGNNLDASSGSPMLAMMRTAGRVALDVELSRATAQIKALDVLKRAANIEAAAATEEGKAVTAAFQRTASHMRAQSLRLLGVSQDERAASLVARGRGFLDRAEDEENAGWLGAAGAFLKGGAELAGMGAFKGASLDISGTGLWNPASGKAGSYGV